MKANYSDLIAIANAGLAEKLDKAAEKEAKKQAQAVESKDQAKPKAAFKQDIWKAIYTLNIMRYLFAASLLVVITLSYLKPDWNPIKNLLYPNILIGCTVAVLFSAIGFSYLTKKRIVGFNNLVLAQFSLDLVLAALITHSCGSIDSSFALLFFVAVGTGSVVLPRVQAIGLASGGIILLFYEHLYSSLKAQIHIEPNYESMIRYGLVLFTSAWLISYLAQRLRIAELKSYVPGNETIEDFLVREEINALKAALKSTDGNKTKAAKLLGMTFRSFRYKLTKYDID